jgi:hypothetical protein
MCGYENKLENRGMEKIKCNNHEINKIGKVFVLFGVH